MNDIDQLDWPPSYTTRVSARAKHVQFRISPHKGLELVLPKRHNPSELPQLFEEHRAWIQKNLSALPQRHEPLFPTIIHLRSINQRWEIRYEQKDQTQIRIKTCPPNTLLICGPADQPSVIYKKLRDWLKTQALHYLKPWLDEISDLMQLPFTKVAFRGQATRWGSCSREKHINLNYKLLFLPAHLVEHVLIHELCHTVHLNHSAAFWRLVKRFDKHYRLVRRQLSDANRYLPLWIET